MIIITGPTGQLGSHVVQALLARVPADQLGVSIRDVERGADLSARGVRVRHGDFTQPESLNSAFEGATQVLIISSGTRAGDSVPQHLSAMNAARDAGAQRVLYTSHQGASPTSLFAPMLDHAANEENLSKLGVPFTALRNGFYASSVGFMLGRALQTGEIVAPEDGPVSWTAHSDLAEAAATILAEEGRFNGPTPALIAPDHYDLADIAGILSELTGRHIRRTVLNDDEWTENQLGNGVPASAVRMLLGMYRASRRGEFFASDPTLEELLGRPALSIRHVLQRFIAGT